MAGTTTAAGPRTGIDLLTGSGNTADALTAACAIECLGTTGETTVRIADIIADKGRTVHTVHPWADVAEAVARLRDAGIGALLVCDGDGGICGIVSERDIVRAISVHGAKLLATPVAEIMTRNVAACAPDDTITRAMAQMTHGRFRHLPVLDDGELVGLISIGDLVKHRLRDLELETGVLRDRLLIARS